MTFIRISSNSCQADADITFTFSDAILFTKFTVASRVVIGRSLRRYVKNRTEFYLSWNSRKYLTLHQNFHASFPQNVKKYLTLCKVFSFKVYVFAKRKILMLRAYLKSASCCLKEVALWVPFLACPLPHEHLGCRWGSRGLWKYSSGQFWFLVEKRLLCRLWWWSGRNGLLLGTRTLCRVFAPAFQRDRFASRHCVLPELNYGEIAIKKQLQKRKHPQCRKT